MKRADIHRAVRDRYAALARQDPACRAEGTPRNGASPEGSKALGYTGEQLGEIPAGADLGLGCGNPISLASLRKGEVILALGSGAGIDCFLAANAAGGTGGVIGVDMTAKWSKERVQSPRKAVTATSSSDWGRSKTCPSPIIQSTW